MKLGFLADVGGGFGVEVERHLRILLVAERVAATAGSIFAANASGIGPHNG